MEREADQGEIKKAFLLLARKYHPDVNKSKDAPKRFSDINEAYETLKDPNTRKTYDSTGMSSNEQQNYKDQGGQTDASFTGFNPFGWAFGGTKA